MSNIAIAVENLSKRYRIGYEQQARDTFAEVLLAWVTRPIKNYRRLRELTNFKDENYHDPENVIWALKDISFAVERGEIIGVIGKNGAGKSTLLKILSRITHPTSGVISLNGRVSSLLEVGTGFHPELTGRDNVYLNGTILGMTKDEIDKKFDEIVDFSGVSKFIDTPVKFYSSGMGVRLAFSVAAHLEPEILLIDEVLSVGDAMFQKKSLGKMQEVSRKGRTVLFVSHNMGAVRALCSRALLIEDGKLKKQGPVDDVINEYLANKDVSTTGLLEWNQSNAPQSEEIVFLGIKTNSNSGEVKSTFAIDEPFEIVIQYKIIEEVRNLRLYLKFRNSLGEAVFTTLEDSAIQKGFVRKPGKYSATCKIPPNLLNNLSYLIYVGFDSPGSKVLVPGTDYLEVDIIDTSDGYRYAKGTFDGPVRPEFNWEVEEYK
ncbi:MAG: ABC transporter ATP-binding protein [Anaerolineales bacterium]|nr:ABC transporter ATP-binding protein [Anaerolineales bacterium]